MKWLFCPAFISLANIQNFANVTLVEIVMQTKQLISCVESLLLLAFVSVSFS